MVDFRPLLFLNALIVMLFLTAGFAHVKHPATINTLLADASDTPSFSESSVPALDTATSIASIPADEPELMAEPSVFADSTAPETTETAPIFADADFADTEAAASDNSPEVFSTPTDEGAELVATLDASKTMPAVEPSVPAVTPSALPAVEPPATVVEPTTGKLIVRSNVHDDQVRINGKSYGSTMLNLELAPGSYIVEVSKPGYTSWSRTVELDRGAETSLSASLAQITTVEFRDGNWRYGVTTGEGTYRDNTGLRYEGGFLNKQFHGTGTLTLADGTRYEGGWSNGKKDGYGTLKLPSGDTYVGRFQNDEFNGEGTLTKSNGDIYAGIWKNGLLNGDGSLTTQQGLMYVGSFVDNQFSGPGTITYPDGTHYEGNFAKNLYHGKGMLTYKDGKKYTGNFHEGKYHGKGELLNPNGSKITSTFKSGKPYGQVTLTTPHGEVFTARSSEPGVCYRLKSYRATQCPPMEGW